MKILVPKLKTDHHREGHIGYISRVSSECCPVKFFEKYLQKTNMELCKDGETPLISRNFKTKKGHKISKTHGISHSRIKEVFKDYITDITEDSEKHSLHSLPANTPLVFYVETTWKRKFSRRFNVEYKRCVCWASGWRSFRCSQQQRDRPTGVKTGSIVFK